VSSLCVKENDEIFNNLKKNKVLVEGNYKLIEDFFQRDLGKEQVKFLFLGDNFNSDCVHSGKIENWNSVAVYEDLETGRIGYFPANFGKMWKEGCENKSDYFMKMLRDYTLFTISNVDALKYLN
jgi:hypothetical protein